MDHCRAALRSVLLKGLDLFVLAAYVSDVTLGKVGFRGCVETGLQAQRDLASLAHISGTTSTTVVIPMLSGMAGDAVSTIKVCAGWQTHVGKSASC
jgi:hypothetical protein